VIRTARHCIANTLRAAAPPAVILFVAAVLLRFPPSRYSFYPQCPVYEYLHLQCPGCGVTRALAALLRGHLADAIHFNPLVTLLTPFAVAYGILCYHRFLQRKPFPRVDVPPAAIYGALTVAGVFAAIRNLPSF
jgi:hypothetical protein